MKRPKSQWDWFEGVAWPVLMIASVIIALAVQLGMIYLIVRVVAWALQQSGIV